MMIAATTIPPRNSMTDEYDPLKSYRNPTTDVNNAFEIVVVKASFG